MKVLIGILALLGIMGGGAGFFFMHGTTQGGGGFRTALAERGNLMAIVAATGVVQAENVVDVGAQNSIPCQIKGFGPDTLRNPQKFVDFRSPVAEGMILAQLDDSIYRLQKEQADADVELARANVLRAEADLSQMEAKVVQAERDWARAKRLINSKGVISDIDYDTAQAVHETCKSSLAVGKVAIIQAQKSLVKAEAALKQAETNLSYCTIKSPVNGVVIDRRVNVGQTVVSGLTASSLFLIAEDLKRLEVWAAVNEADIGSIQKGQKVRFTVDTFPNEPFYGIVTEIRLNAQMTQNVVTYPVVVTVDNSSLKLLPYMTANLQFEVNQRENILIVPNAALRWKPQVSQVSPDVRADFARSQQYKSQPGKVADKERQGKGTVWVADGSFVRPLKLKIGSSDGTMTEVLGGELEEGAALVIGAAPTNNNGDAGTVNPFAPQFQPKPKQ